MSLYNLLNGFNAASFFLLPMLGKHPSEYPRFRDCFLKHDDFPQYDNHIFVFTRAGGGNRRDYESEIDSLRKIPEYVDDFDDESDSTYAFFVFRVPDKWKADFGAVIEGRFSEISNEYRSELKRVFPKLADKIDELWPASKTESEVGNG